MGERCVGALLSPSALTTRRGDIAKRDSPHPSAGRTQRPTQTPDTQSTRRPIANPHKHVNQHQSINTGFNPTTSKQVGKLPGTCCSTTCTSVRHMWQYRPVSMQVPGALGWVCRVPQHSPHSPGTGTCLEIAIGLHNLGAVRTRSSFLALGKQVATTRPSQTGRGYCTHAGGRSHGLEQPTAAPRMPHRRLLGSW